MPEVTERVTLATRILELNEQIDTVKSDLSTMRKERETLVQRLINESVNPGDQLDWRAGHDEQIDIIPGDDAPMIMHPPSAERLALYPVPPAGALNK